MPAKAMLSDTPPLSATPLSATPPSAPARRRRHGVSAVEVLAIVIFTAMVTIVGTTKYQRDADPVIQELKRSYGPDRVTQWHEEWIIRDFFKDRKGGVFLDVGANHYKTRSNTYFLESRLGWSGLAVDAIEEYGADYKTHRPQTRYVAMFASDVDSGKVRFFIGENALVSSVDPEFAKRNGGVQQTREVPTATLNTLLDQAGLIRIDFLSMDIELAEPKALAGFDIARFKPELVCIEGHAEVRQQILDYFGRHGYVPVGKYLWADQHNLYFQPLR